MANSTEQAQARCVEDIAASVEAHLIKHLADKGDAATLALVFGTLSGASTFLGKMMGATYAVETLHLYTEPLQDLVTQHGGPGVGTKQ